MQPDLNPGKWLIMAGAFLIVTGVVVLVVSRFVKFGQLPGDLRIERGRSTFYFPIATSILISLLLTLLLNLLLRWRGPR